VYADQFEIYHGNSNPDLARKIARWLGTECGKAEVFQFANENIFVKILDNVREKDIFLIQPTCHPVNQSIMELLIMIDAFKRASAGRITAVIPYYAYGRSDKKDQPRVPITARLIALEGRKTGLVSAVQQVTEEDDQLMLISAGGQVIRTETNSINRYSSGARGVIVMRLGEGDKVVAISAFREGLAERGAIGDNDDPQADGAGPADGGDRSP
jgi:hypothetical protein